MATIKAAQIIEREKVRFVNVELLPLEDGKVKVRMVKVVLCGSDIPYFTGETFLAKYPLRPGRAAHECVGVVEESRSPEYKPGDMVLVLPPDQDALTEYVVFEPANLLKLPDGYDLDILIMSQLLGTVLHACQKIDPVVDKTVAVVGQGPVGLLFDAMLRNLGARRVIGLDLVDNRLEMGRTMGATQIINPSHLDPKEIVREITDGEMADLVVEAAGTEASVNSSLDLIRYEGTILLFSVPRSQYVNFNIDDFLRDELKMIASHQRSLSVLGFDTRRDFSLALDLLTQGFINVKPMITHHLPFSQIQRAYEIVSRKEDGVIKLIVEF